MRWPPTHVVVRIAASVSRPVVIMRNVRKICSLIVCEQDEDYGHDDYDGDDDAADEDYDSGLDSSGADEMRTYIEEGNILYGCRCVLVEADCVVELQPLALGVANGCTRRNDSDDSAG